MASTSTSPIAAGAAAGLAGAVYCSYASGSSAAEQGLATDSVAAFDMSDIRTQILQVRLHKTPNRFPTFWTHVMSFPALRVSYCREDGGAESVLVVAVAERNRCASTAKHAVHRCGQRRRPRQP